MKEWVGNFDFVSIDVIKLRNGLLIFQVLYRFLKIIFYIKYKSTRSLTI